MSGPAMYSIGGIESDRICAYSPNVSMMRSRASTSYSIGMLSQRLIGPLSFITSSIRRKNGTGKTWL